ncbi:hypothetical protein KEM54_002731, partial [Ascosphaera aggregata]
HQYIAQPGPFTTPKSHSSSSDCLGLPFSPHQSSPLSPLSPLSRKSRDFGNAGDRPRTGRAAFERTPLTPVLQSSPSTPLTPVQSSPFMSRESPSQNPAGFRANEQASHYGDKQTSPSQSDIGKNINIDFNFQPQPQSRRQGQQEPQEQQQICFGSPSHASNSQSSRRSTPSGTSHILSSRPTLSTRRSAFLNRIRQSRSDSRYSARHDKLTRLEYLSWIEERKMEIERLKQYAPDLTALGEELEKEEEEVRGLVGWEQGLIEEMEMGEQHIQRPEDANEDDYGGEEYEEIFGDLVRMGEIEELENEARKKQSYEDSMDIDMD